MFHEGEKLYKCPWLVVCPPMLKDEGEIGVNSFELQDLRMTADKLNEVAIGVDGVSLDEVMKIGCL